MLNYMAEQQMVKLKSGCTGSTLASLSGGTKDLKPSHFRMTNTIVTPPVNTTGAPVTNTVEPPAEGQSSNSQAVQAVEAWKHSDFLCHNYVLNGHHATNCKMSKWVNPRQENMVNDDMDMIAMVSDISAIISEVNLVEKLIIDRSCTWATLLLLISRANEMLF
nr:hypothetical protein [Tanacetum cinerariifolium]